MIITDWNSNIDCKRQKWLNSLNSKLLLLIYSIFYLFGLKNKERAGAVYQFAVILEGTAPRLIQQRTNFDNQPGHNCISEIETSQQKIGNPKI